MTKRLTLAINLILAHSYMRIQISESFSHNVIGLVRGQGIWEMNICVDGILTASSKQIKSKLMKEMHLKLMQFIPQK